MLLGEGSMDTIIEKLNPVLWEGIVYQDNKDGGRGKSRGLIETMSEETQQRIRECPMQKVAEQKITQ